MPISQLGGILYIFPPGPRGGGCLYFPLKHKSAMYTFVQQRGGGSRRDPNHKSMYKCAYMYVHLSLSPPPRLGYPLFLFCDKKVPWVLFENYEIHPPTLWVLLGMCSIKKVPAPPSPGYIVMDFYRSE